MPWSVRIQDEAGKPASHEDIEVPFRMLDQLPPDAIMLMGIDRYQDTTFNGTQLKLLLAEWESLAPQITNPEDRATWEKVQAYARQCVSEPHLYLKFIGD